MIQESVKGRPLYAGEKRMLLDEEQIRNSWFREHKAYFGTFSIPDNMPAEIAKYFENHKILNWSKQGRHTYSIQYYISGRYLFVSGDLECAIYAWSNSISFDFLASCSADYFASKCVASENGPQGEQWYEDICIENLENFLLESTKEAYLNGILDPYNSVNENEDKDWESLANEQKSDLINKYIFHTVFVSPSRNSRQSNFIRFEDYKNKIETMRNELLEACISEYSWTKCLNENHYLFNGLDSMPHGNGISLCVRAHLIGIQMAINQAKNQIDQTATPENNPIPTSRPLSFWQKITSLFRRGL